MTLTHPTSPTPEAPGTPGASAPVGASGTGSEAGAEPGTEPTTEHPAAGHPQAPADARHLPLADQAPEPREYTVSMGDLDALAAVATVLSRWLMSPPDAETLAVACAPDMLAEWPLPAERATMRGLRELARHRDENETAESIAADHLRLFIGPGHAVASPYESVHRSLEGLLFDEQTLQVREWYKRFGLSAPREGKEPDDHIALELEFVALLLGAAEAKNDDDASLFAQAVAQFTTAHLRTWAPAWFGIVLTQADTAFYRGVAHLGLGLLDELATTFPE